MITYWYLLVLNWYSFFCKLKLSQARSPDADQGITIIRRKWDAHGFLKVWREKSILKIASFLSWWPFCFFQIFLSPCSDQKTITNQIFRLRVFKLRCLALYSANPSIIPIPRRSKSLSWEKEKKGFSDAFWNIIFTIRSLIKKIYHNHNQNLIFIWFIN